MKLIVGLGNPGLKYKNTRHNIGYKIVKQLAEDCSAGFKKSYLTKSLIAKVNVETHPVRLVLPITFMNLSGRAVAKIVKRYKIEPENILVVCDDIDSTLGKIRLRPSGSDGGHQGIRSIIEALGESDFARIKIGIGRPNRKEDVARYVLSDFKKEENLMLADIIYKAVECCKTWVEEGIVKTMNKYNEGKRQ